MARSEREHGAGAALDRSRKERAGGVVTSEEQSTEDIRADMVEEAVRVAEEAESRDVALRLLGGVAIKVRAHDGLEPAFEREYADLDWITQKGKSTKAQRFFESLGYVPQTRFNTMYGRERLLYFNEKDDGDALALLHDHAVDEQDGDTINAAHVAKLCASDWGLWRTFTANLEALDGYLGRFDLEDESKERIAGRVRALLARIEEEPKTFGWKMRAKIGDRKRWYDLPEEVEGGP